LGTEISLAEILGLAEEIERKYAEDGYTTTRVVLKEKPGAAGNITLLIIERL
jgi:hemolysin activation/secretion protein